MPTTEVQRFATRCRFLAGALGVAGLINLMANGDGAFVLPGLALLAGAVLALAATRGSLIMAGVVALLGCLPVIIRLQIQLRQHPAPGGPWAPGSGGFIPGDGAFNFIDRITLGVQMVFLVVLLILWAQAWTWRPRLPR